MDITRAALRNPAAVAVAVALTLIFGLVAMSALPLQLFPDIERPQMSINTSWRAASPTEIESELVKPQEEVLQGLAGLEELEANAFPGGSWVNLTFAIGTDMSAATVDVLGRLNRLPPMPADADPPVVQMQSQDANSSLSWFFVQQLPGTAGIIEDYAQFVTDVVKPRIEAVPGVAAVDVNGGAPEELVVRFDPWRAAELGVSIPQVSALAGRSQDISGGVKDVGRRQYTLRFAGRYTPEQLADMVLAWRDGRPVKLGDVAQIEIKRPPRNNVAWQNGNPAIGLNVRRESGANVLDTLAAVKQAVAELREGPLKQRGLGIEQSFDSGLFIHRAVNLLSGNLFAGVLLAVGCLWWFLRDGRATLLIASAIPVSLFATFIVLQLVGRSLNVISLAGLAFAVGMVMDAAIVVAENIVRLREAGKVPDDAAAQGAREVRGALWASTFTTVAVFAPVLFLRDVEGQLFSDLALTIAIAVVISMVVAITVLPAAAGGWLRAKRLSLEGQGYPRISAAIMRATATRGRQWLLTLALTALPLALALWWAPALDYLPPVKRAAVDAFIGFPPGMSPETADREIGSIIRARMAPYMRGEKQPALKNWYILLWPGGGTIGARVIDEGRIGELERIINSEILAGLPDTRAFAQEGELFGGFGGSARAIAVHLQAADIETVMRAAEQGRGLLEQTFAGANVQVFPDAGVPGTELRVQADDRALAEAGWTRAELGSAVRTLGEGTWLGEYFDGDRRLNIILRGDAWQSPEQLAELPLVTGNGQVHALNDLARISTEMAAGQYRRIDGRRTITLTVDPPATLSLEAAVARVQQDVVPRLRAWLPADANVRVAGSADRLQGLLGGMARNFALALLVLFMLMAAMFRSLKDSALVMLTLPLAVFGGVLGLRALGLFTPAPLDVLSMIGFIMLLGMVINNGILLIAQTRAAEAAGATLEQALRQALDQRLRPILIGALTGMVGALPMAISPGPGAVIYRGLAAVTVGGVGLSLTFVAVLIPAVLRLLQRARPAIPTTAALPRLEAA
jgi:multidrug efflux pump subunit AcrB